MVVLVAFLSLASGNVFSQQTKQPGDDVIRTSTELVQSSVTVLDKSGKFVEGLTRDQFEVVIDGKPRSLSFFERITAGSAREKEAILKNSSTSSAATVTAPPTSVGRTIVFFIDDLHLSPE